MSPHKVDVLPSVAALTDYGISKNGFLPAETPLTRLSHHCYQPWESIIRQLATLIETQQIRHVVDQLPVLGITSLNDVSEWQRAYSILTVIAQGYIWAGPEPSERLPPCITVPLLSVSERLEVPPIATYAALNLWNWRPLADNYDPTRPDSLVANQTATGTDDESWFLVISNAMEARAGPLIDTMLRAMAAVEQDDIPTIVLALQYFANSMEDIGILLERMDERCNPFIFYHTIRPFLAGSMNMEAAGLPQGVFYDEGQGQGSWRKYRGGSNGQSSLLQFCDAVLSVHHSKSDFHAEMRKYMPGPHARFLEDIEATSKIRSYVATHQDETELLMVFNEAIAALSRFRDKHIALVTRYIIIPSRMGTSKDTARRKDLASISTGIASDKSQAQALVGTGGTKLIPFLRTSRDETTKTSIGTSHQRKLPPNC